jgi:hypothetical protein
MPAKLNAHRVFHGTDDYPAFLQALRVDAGQEELLRNARDQIRSTLRNELPNWEPLIKGRGLINRKYTALAMALPPPQLRPRFRMQGSYVYHTLNEPAHKPPQEIDFDDGMYLPTSFIENGDVEPLLAANGYFTIVEKTLEPLCQRNRWELRTHKPTCVRIEITPDAHIDLPLYAIPDQEFGTLANFATADLRKSAHGASLTEDEVFKDYVYRRLRQDRIMLARRDGWIASDPRKIEDWFNKAVSDHGDVLRRVCRYLKGWRDHQWAHPRLSSLAIMAVVVAAFEELAGELPGNRDDVALLLITERLPALLAQRIQNPVIPEQALNGEWKPAETTDIVVKVRNLHDSLCRALGSSEINSALHLLRAEFGGRLPNSPRLISTETEEHRILTYAPAIVSAPSVTRTKSG